MKWYVVIIGTLLLFLSALFLLLSYVSPFKKHNTPRDTVANANTTLYFQPNSLTSSCSNTQHTVPIYLSTNKPVNSSQIELQFNPNEIYNVFLEPIQTNNFFGENKNYEVTLQEVRETYGRASLAMQLNTDRVDISGDKPVALLTFTTLPSTQTSTISFLDKSTIGSTGREESVLSKTLPLTFHCITDINRTSTPSSQLNITPAQ